MAAGTKICKVCDKEYPYCRTNRDEGIFRWQDVACCPEHGSIYFARIMESRGVKMPDEEKAVQDDNPGQADLTAGDDAAADVQKKTSKKTSRTKK